jgi:methylenetetrahydrofolate reductase (NADPH)
VADAGLGAAASALARTLGSGSFALTAEIAPPVSGAPDALLARAEALRGLVDAVNVTDAASARVAMSSLAAAAILARAGIEPVLQITCRDRNRIAIQSDLLGAAALGVRNVLALTGDDPKAGDQPDAKPVFDLASGDIIRIAAAMRDRGVVASGREIDSPPPLFIGCADLPVDPKPDWRPDSLKAKADAGAQFVQTQLCWDVALIRRYVARLAEHGLTERLHILVGVGPLASARSAKWMREHLFGVIVPDAVIARLEGAADQKSEGTRICAEMLDELATIPGIAGAHLMAPVNPGDIPRAIAGSSLANARPMQAV